LREKPGDGLLKLFPAAKLDVGPQVLVQSIRQLNASVQSRGHYLSRLNRLWFHAGKKNVRLKGRQLGSQRVAPQATFLRQTPMSGGYGRDDFRERVANENQIWHTGFRGGPFRPTVKAGAPVRMVSSCNTHFTEC
jgi:hypothetical protein